MSSNCPTASTTADPTLVLQTATLKAGIRLVRFQGMIYPADSFNPNTNKHIEIPEHGARFNPFPGAPLKNIGTLYAADSLEAAALESVFHDVDHTPSPWFPRAKLADWRYSRIELLSDLTVFSLTNPRLRQITVSGRTTSLTEDELIHSPPSEYPNIRTWARFLHASVPTIQGFSWRPRLGGRGRSYVFFADRCGKDALKLVSAIRSIDSNPGLAKIDRIAKRASIRIV